MHNKKLISLVINKKIFQMSKIFKFAKTVKSQNLYKMKLNNLLKLTLIIGVISIVLSGCKGSAVTPRQGFSRTTGWRYNDSKWGSFEVVQYVEQPTGPNLVLIEGGVFTMGNVEQDVMFDWNSFRRRVTISSFYMDQTEVANIDYLEYLHWLTRVFIDYPEIVEKAKPDTLVWRSRLAYNEPFVEYYFRYPAFQDYPVVGVSWVQANDYCQWRTDRVNERLLVEAGIIDLNPTPSAADNFNTEAYLVGLSGTQPKGNLKDLAGNPRNARLEDGIILPRYRLPTEAEWEYAAWALIGNSEAERISNYKFYPWTSHQLRNPERQYRGQFYANFVRGRGDYMGVAGYLNDNAAPTAPVDSYWPNDFGLYCMAGNVSEWVLDVYRPLSNIDVDDFNPYRGNIFETFVKNKNGEYIKNDTTGGLYRRKMGETHFASDLTQDDVAHELNRYNYKTADNRNYKDGDVRSRLEGDPDWITDDELPGSQRMYNYYGDDLEQKNHKNATSLITDESRVYKGGSWADRAYWLSPGTRRFMDQNRSTADIGFRCAMIRVGAPGGIKVKR